MSDKGQQISTLEIDLLLLFYTFSDQYGHVDIYSAQKWAKEKLGVIIPNKPFTLSQVHVDALVKSGAVADISDIINKVKNLT